MIRVVAEVIGVFSVSGDLRGSLLRVGTDDSSSRARVSEQRASGWAPESMIALYLSSITRKGEGSHGSSIGMGVK